MTQSTAATSMDITDGAITSSQCQDNVSKGIELILVDQNSVIHYFANAFV